MSRDSVRLGRVLQGLDVILETRRIPVGNLECHALGTLREHRGTQGDGTYRAFVIRV